VSTLVSESTTKYVVSRASSEIPEFRYEVHAKCSNDGVLESVSCTCSFFCSNLLPCRHVACVLSQHFNKTPFDVCLLPSRWRLNRHPLFIIACQRLGLASSICRPLVASEATQNASVHVHLSAYQQIVYPRDEGARYSRLMQNFKQQVAVAQNSPNLYKRTMMSIAELINSAGACQTELEAESANPASILPPPQAKAQI